MVSESALSGARLYYWSYGLSSGQKRIRHHLFSLLYSLPCPSLGHVLGAGISRLWGRGVGGMGGGGGLSLCRPKNKAIKNTESLLSVNNIEICLLTA